MYHVHPSSWQDYFKAKISRAYWRMIVYRRYPEKAIKDTYTPQILKLQIPLAALLTLGLAAATISRAICWLWLALPFLITTLPTLRFAWRRERGDLVWAPVGLWLRSTAFLIGVVWGVMRPFDLDQTAEAQPRMPSVVTEAEADRQC